MRLIHFVFRGGLFKFKLRSNLKKKKKIQMFTNEQNFKNRTYWKKKKEWFSI